MTSARSASAALAVLLAFGARAADPEPARDAGAAPPERSPERGKAGSGDDAGATVPPRAPRPEAACPAGMSFVSGGTYTLGDRKDEATVASFCLDRTEVTVAAFAACVRRGRCRDAGLRCDEARANWGREGRDDHPINCVDWDAARAFCRAAGKRLPTEEEWEWAARGGAKGRRFAWGDDAPARRACWSGEGNDLGAGKRTSTCRVGSFVADEGPDGIHDLAGNVSEWTSTTDGSGRVYRGGGWSSVEAAELRATERSANLPWGRDHDLGFRCAAGP